MNQTAIVFGATGLVGKELVFELLEDQRFLKVKAVVRTSLPLSHSKLEQIVLKDYSDLESITSQLAADVYFCCIGTTIKKAGSQETFKKIDLNIPVKIAKLAEHLNVPVLIVISSLGATMATSNFYLRTKGEMEQNVRMNFNGNLKFMRPSLLLGHRAEFRLGERIAQILMKPLGTLMFGPLTKYKGINAWDVAKGMIKSIDLPNEKIFVESDEIHKLVNRRKFKLPKEHEIIRIH
ncbi:MAG TPA: NAD(P)H-binding protein [Bacteroidales bacterium]